MFIALTASTLLGRFSTSIKHSRFPGIAKLLYECMNVYMCVSYDEITVPSGVLPEQSGPTASQSRISGDE